MLLYINFNFWKKRLSHFMSLHEFHHGPQCEVVLFMLSRLTCKLGLFLIGREQIVWHPLSVLLRCFLGTLPFFARGVFEGVGLHLQY